MSIREDLIGISGRAPRDVTKHLIAHGGTNPYGEPNYRVVLAQSRVCKQAAEWHDWQKELSIQERGGFVQDDAGNTVPTPHHPLCVVKEMRVIPRYPICECPEGVLVDKAHGIRAEAGDCEECHGVRGWIIEKWWPAHLCAGSEPDWYAPRVDGTDLPRRGPYPAQGEYRRVAMSKATAKVPSFRQLTELLAYLNHCQQNSNLTPAQFRREFELAREEHQRKEDEAEDRRVREIIKESLDPLQGSSLAAGRAREQCANRLRTRGVHIGHVGA